jgi:hypothetical protein
MRVKVTCAIMVYNGETYHNGDYLEIESDTELQILIRERCIVDLAEKKTVARADNNVKTQVRRK